MNVRLIKKKEEFIEKLEVRSESEQDELFRYFSKISKFKFKTLREEDTLIKNALDLCETRENK